MNGRAWSETAVAAARGRVLTLTGAGISAESGIPTYRGANGIWRQYDFEKLATRAAFDADRSRIWAWYEERRRGVRAAGPNAAHRAITALASLASDFLLVTQNVDDLHERAGTHAALVHVHGEILWTRCIACAHRTPASPLDASLPCARCGATLRPDVVWFDEDLPAAALSRIEAFLDGGPCDLVLVVGTTASFDYVLDWITRAAGSTGLVVDVNPGDSPLRAQLGDAVQHVQRPAGDALPELVELVRTR